MLLLTGLWSIIDFMEAPKINADEILVDAVETPLGWVSFALTSKGLLGSTFVYSSKTEALTALKERKAIAPFSEVEEKSTFREVLEPWRSLFSSLLTNGRPPEAEGSEVPIDDGGWTDFSKKVYNYLRTVKAGETVTYGEIARAVGNSGASQAIGMLMKKNPIPPVVPCHRVLAGNGKLGGFSASGGTELKRKMLQNETDPRELLFPPG